MNPDEAFIHAFELPELNNYIFAKKNLPFLEEEYEELVQTLYDDISPTITCFDYDLGRCYKKGFDPEDYAIWMIEKKDGVLKLLNKLRKQEELFDIAMDSLSPRQRDVVQVHYFNRNNDLGLSLDFFNEILVEAQNKLCSFIGGERQKERNTVEQERKQQLKSDLDEWKRGRVVS